MHCHLSLQLETTVTQLWRC